MKIQVVSLDLFDFILQYKTFYPKTKSDTTEMLIYIEQCIKEGDVKITRWDAKTGNRI
jgi:hypothetical protein